MKKKWTVYIIRCSNGKLYTGITVDMKRRFYEHQSGKKGAKFFHTTEALEVVYQEKCRDRSEASKREAQIKKLTRLQKEKILAQKKERTLKDLKGVGKATLQDLALLKIKSLEELRKKDPEKLFLLLEKITQKKQDPCVLDVFSCAIAQAQDPYLPEEKCKWWYWSSLRKSKDKT